MKITGDATKNGYSRSHFLALFFIRTAESFLSRRNEGVRK